MTYMDEWEYWIWMADRLKEPDEDSSGEVPDCEEERAWPRVTSRA